MPRPLLISSPSDYLIQVLTEIHIFNDKQCRSRSEANWYGSTLFAKTGHDVFSKSKVKFPSSLCWPFQGSTLLAPSVILYVAFVLLFNIPNRGLRMRVWRTTNHKVFFCVPAFKFLAHKELRPQVISSTNSFRDTFVDTSFRSFRF